MAEKWRKKRRGNSKNHSVVSALHDWFKSNARVLPWRGTGDPYAVWISEIMLQQTQVKTVIPFYDRWMKRLPDVASVARAKPETVLKLWEGLGYYSRARNLQKAARTIMQEHRGRFPSDFAQVLELPGIGRYTAGAICSIAYNQPVPILDGNVIRVLARLFAITENAKDKSTNTRLWELAAELVEGAQKASTSAQACSHLNQALMELGALLCTPRQPQCLVCPVRPHCLAFKRGLTEVLPNLGTRQVATARRFAALVAEHEGRMLVRQRPVGVVNGGLWEFPNLELNGDPLNPATLGHRLIGWPQERTDHLCTIKHTITRYRITLEVFRTRYQPARGVYAGEGRWCTPAELERLAFPSAHRRIVAHLAKAKRESGSKIPLKL